MRGKIMTVSITKSVARKFVTAHNRVDKALASADSHRVTAAGVVADILNDAPRGSAARLAELSGVAPGTISKYQSLAAALALVPEATEDDKRALTRAIFEGEGDRKAVQEAVKAGNGSDAVKAAKADKPEKSGNGGRGNNGKAVALKDMDTESVIALLAEGTRLVADRMAEGETEHIERFVKFSKSVATIAKNLSKITA
jgi:hypothetical protein